MNYFRESKDNVFVAAHRGLSSKWPENTMVAFQKAIDAGVDQIETDVRITKDGELVLIHDATVDRTSYSTGRVDGYTFEELRKIDVGKIQNMTGYQIPTLIELMELVKDHPTMTLDLELKEYPTEGHEEIAYSVADRVLAIVDQYHFEDRIVINSFSGKLLQYIHGKYGEKYRRHVFYPQSQMGGWRDFTEDPYKTAFCVCMFRTVPNTRHDTPCGQNMPDVEEFEKIRRLYPQIETWAPTCNETLEDAKYIVECGCTAVTTNYADDMLKFLRELGKHE